MKHPEVIGIDIGGTSIKCGLVQNSEVIKTFSTNTDPENETQIILDNLFYAITQVKTKETKAIGIGMPGFIDSAKGIIYDAVNITAWKNLNLKKTVEDKFDIPVSIDNDANCFVAGSKVYGASNPYNNIVGLTLGTGLGAGIILNGKLFSGLNNSAGEFGQIPYNNLTFEDYCSGKFFLSKQNKPGKDSFDLAVSGDEESIRLWNEFGEHLAELIRLISFSLAPEAIVIGGSVSKAYPLFINKLHNKLQQIKFQQPIKDLKILLEENPDISILGAAALCIN